MPPSCYRADGDDAALGRELDGVVKQVHEQLPEPLLVAADRRQVVGHVGRSWTSCRSANVRRRSRVPFTSGADRDLVGADLARGLLDARQVEQLVDHLGEVARLDVDRGHPVTDALRHVGCARARR